MALTDSKKLKEVNTSNTDDIIDINLDVATRTRFRINGDSNAIIELNLSDLGILDRLKSGVEKLNKEMSEIANIPDDDENLSEKMKQADQRMREYVDYIFDYPVSAVCAKYGTMYDPKDGKFRYETILDSLTNLYADNINAEYRKMENRMKKYTDKYTKPAKGKKK